MFNSTELLRFSRVDPLPLKQTRLTRLACIAALCKQLPTCQATLHETGHLERQNSRCIRLYNVSAAPYPQLAFLKHSTTKGAINMCTTQYISNFSPCTKSAQHEPHKQAVQGGLMYSACIILWAGTAALHCMYLCPAVVAHTQL